MKQYIVLVIFIFWFSYYLLTEYNKRSDFKDAYNSTKQELLTQKNPTYIPSKTIYADEITSEDKIVHVQKTEKVHLDVQFYPQSPFGKWWPIFEDTCEEASVLIAINYMRWKTMTRTQFRDELLNIVDWENKTFGYYKDTGVNDTAIILKDYFNFLDYKILENPSIDDIKYELSQKNIIISPFFASNLNPNYSWSWPDYHFMVITGYTKDSFITHDVWTKQWEDYYYNQNTLYNRIHDFDPIDIENWPKRLIVLKNKD
jgi:hypothetical protein